MPRAAVSAFCSSAAHHEKAECGHKPHPAFLRPLGRKSPAGAFPLGEPTGHFAAKRKVSEWVIYFAEVYDRISSHITPIKVHLRYKRGQP